MAEETRTVLNIFFYYSSARQMKIVMLGSAAGLIDTGGGTDPDVLLKEKRTKDALGRL